MADAMEPTTDKREIQMPEWEHEGKDATAQSRPGGTTRSGLKSRFDSLLPPHRRYLGLSRKVFLLIVLAIFLTLIALIVGLAAGLTKRSQYAGDARKKFQSTDFLHSGNLPLPSNTKQFVGQLTYYEPGLGACGETDSSSDNIVAVSHILFDAAGSSSSTGGNSNANPLCNKMLRASRYDEEVGAQRSVDLKVVDRCVGCDVDNIDTSESAFKQLAPIASGRVDVTWAWLQPVQTGS